MLFLDFALKAQTTVLNLDNPETAAILPELPRERTVTYGLSSGLADLVAVNPEPRQDGVAFSLQADGETFPVTLKVPGLHNVANALAALAAARAVGVPLKDAAQALAGFTGIRRRLEVVGTNNGVTVIDDFAHNPDKISATLDTLHAFPGRLLVMFQPHGYGPLKLMKDVFVDTFADKLGAEDVLLMPEPVYFGGTVDRSVGSRDLTDAIAARGRTAEALPDRAACGRRLLEFARPGDRIVIMGARDDTLSQFAAEVLEGAGQGRG